MAADLRDWTRLKPRNSGWYWYKDERTRPVRVLIVFSGGVAQVHRNRREVPHIPFLFEDMNGWWDGPYLEKPDD